MGWEEDRGVFSWLPQPPSSKALGLGVSHKPRGFGGRVRGELTIFLDEHSHVVTDKGADIKEDGRGRVGAEAEGDLLSSNIVDGTPIPRHRPARPRIVGQAVPGAVVARHITRSVVARNIARLIAWHGSAQHVGELPGRRAQCRLKVIAHPCTSLKKSTNI